MSTNTQQPTSQLSKSELPRWLLMVVVVVLMIQYAVACSIFVVHSWKTINFTYPLDYGEGPILDQVIRLSRFENIYRDDLTDPPYTISNYPPLYPLVQVPFMWVFGPALWYGRVINVLSVLVAAVSIGLALHAMTEDKLASVIGGLTLLTIPYVWSWAGFTRVDALALGLSCAGLFVVARWADRRWGLACAAILLTAAVYTRQSYGLAAPFAAFVWLLREPPRRWAFELAGIVAALGFGALLVLTLVTGRGFFFNVVTANVNPFYWDTVFRYMREIIVHVPYLLLCSVVFIVWGAWKRVPSWWLIAPYLLGATLSALTIGKDGSNVNYLYEFSAALSLVVGAVVAMVGQRQLSKSATWLQVIVLFLLIVQVRLIATWSREGFYGRTQHRLRETPEIAQMAHIVRTADGPVLADEYMGLIPTNGKRLYLQPFEFKQLQEAGVWDQGPFLAALERQDFAVILLYEPPQWDSRRARWTPQMLMYIERYYDRTAKLAQTAVYTPATFSLSD